MDCTAGCPKVLDADGKETADCSGPGNDDDCVPVAPNAPTEVWHKNLPQPGKVQAIEVKAITMINAEFITALESVFTNQMYMSTTLQSCATTLQQMALKHPEKMLRDHTRMHMDPDKSAAESMTVKDAATALTPAIVQARRASTQAFVKHFYGPCASQISKHSNDGRMTKYWWDFPECMPLLADSAAGEPTDDEKKAVTTSCLGEGVTYTKNKKDQTADPGRTASCTNDESLKGVGNTNHIPYFGLDVFVLKFCMPEIDVHAGGP